MYAGRLTFTKPFELAPTYGVGIRWPAGLTSPYGSRTGCEASCLDMKLPSGRAPSCTLGVVSWPALKGNARAPLDLLALDTLVGHPSISYQSLEGLNLRYVLVSLAPGYTTLERV